MEVLTTISLGLLATLGYAAGATIRAGRTAEVKPRGIDLIIIAAIWGGALSTRLVFGLDRWLAIPVCVAIGLVVGMLAVRPQPVTGPAAPPDGEPSRSSNRLAVRIWWSWQGFSQRMGSYQTRLALSTLFFLLVTPTALLKTLLDALGTRHRGGESHWLPRRAAGLSAEDFRRQF